MNDEEKAREIQANDVCCVWNGGCPNVRSGAMKMAKWKDEQFKQQLNSLKDEIQSNLCASSGFNDEYSSGYQDCGMKVMEMIDKILNK